MFRTQIPLLSALAFACAPAALHAQSVQLDDMVITASGRVQPISDVQAAVQVIDRQTIDNQSAHNVTGLLKYATGLQTSNAGTNGSVSIRGFNSDQTLLLINGQRRTGSYQVSNFNQIGTFDIERIEIVRGPLSSLYGSDALGGVVNVITRQPGENPGVSLSLTGGKAVGGRETLHSGINLRFGDSQLGHSLVLEQESRDHLRYAGSQEDDSGRLENLSAAYRGRWSPDDLQALSWTVEIFDRDRDAHSLATIRTPGQPTETRRYSSYEDERRNFYGLEYQRFIGDGELKLRTSYGRTSATTNRSGYGTPREKTLYKQYQNDAIYSLPVADSHQVTFGGGYLRDKLELTVNAKTAAADNTFLLLQDEWQIDDRWTLVAGFRYDRFDDFDNSLTPRVSLGWRHQGWHARIGYGEGFKTPSLRHQYASFTRGSGPSRVTVLGNQALDAESSKTWELAFGRTFQDLALEVVLHDSRIKDLLDTAPIAPPPGATVPNYVQYINVNKARMRGMEITADWSVNANWNLRAGYDWLDARDDDSDERLTGRARRTYRLESEWRLANWTLSARARHQGDFYAPGCLRGCDYYDSRQTLVDLNIRNQLTPSVELFVGVDNLFNQRDPANFKAIGSENANDPDSRYLYLGTRWEF